MRRAIPLALVVALVLAPLVWAEDGPAAPPPPKPEQPEQPEQPSARTRADIEELVRGGGRLPEGFVPEALGSPSLPFGEGGPAQAALGRALGGLLLKYLAEKDDPARVAAYEALLRDVAEVLTTDESGDLRRVAPQLMTRFLAGMADPAKKPVYREVLSLLGQALTAGLTPAPAAPAAPSLTFAGATLIWSGRSDGALVARVALVPAGSIAEAAGLRVGDDLLAVDAKPADPAALKRAAGAFVPGGQLRLTLRRKEGTVETLDLEFETEAGAGDR
ncbi:MAG: hypothetical protein O2894_06450 [Planctomycetota bacterium]|nr:hypothetical protein [Planctomycetota bacterium]